MSQDLSFLEQDIMGADLEPKVAKGGQEYELTTWKAEKKGPDASGHTFWMVYFKITDGKMEGQSFESWDEVRPISRYVQVPIIGTDKTEDVKSRLREVQSIFKAFEFDPGMNGQQLIDAEFDPLEELFSETRTTWALLREKNDANFGKVNEITKFSGVQ